MERNLDIDRLRAVAVVCTIYAHIQALWMWDTWFMDLIPFEKGLIGSIGVFLFFIISGYVISLTLMKKIDSALSGEIKKSQVIKSFFIKRLFRITPSCLLWVTLSYIGLYFIAPEYIKGNTEAALQQYLMLQIYINPYHLRYLIIYHSIGHYRLKSNSI